ncbi:MAG: SDR family oxidoreductase [Halolamina sp.]
MPETAIVAGVGPTIGEAVARRFHDAGMNVALLARSTDHIEDLAAELGERALAVRADVTDQDAVAAAAESVRGAFGRVSVLVCNAAAGGGAPLAETTPEQFEQTWRVRAYGSFLLVQAVREDLLDTGGTVLFSGTTYATQPTPEQVSWGSAAPATRGLARTLNEAMDGVHVCYVRIGTAVRPEPSPVAVGSEVVAERYLELVEQETATTPEALLERP